VLLSVLGGAGLIWGEAASCCQESLGSCFCGLVVIFFNSIGEMVVLRSLD
jgi:hypothetical protein